jgi:hypothetical protein
MKVTCRGRRGGSDKSVAVARGGSFDGEKASFVVSEDNRRRSTFLPFRPDQRNDTSGFSQVQEDGEFDKTTSLDHPSSV